jgi:serine protease Do
MKGVDLDLFQFDYDLTFAIMLLDADGAVHHRYGGRDHHDAERWLSIESLMVAMRATLEEHRTCKDQPRNAEATTRPARVVEKIPAFRPMFRNEDPSCVHCHMVNDVLRAQAQADGEWTRDALWVYPAPEKIGLELDRDDPRRVTGVTAGSPAARGGLSAGDTLDRLGETAIASFADVAFALHRTAPAAKSLAYVAHRKAERITGEIPLGDGWKVATSLEYSWRPFKWRLHPQPGFGGVRLEGAELRALELPDDAFALRITYIVDWGDDARTGRNARKAGLETDDVVLSVAGKSDFASEQHLQAWFRLEQKPGETVDVVILRNGERRTVRLPVID